MDMWSGFLSTSCGRWMGRGRWCIRSGIWRTEPPMNTSSSRKCSPSQREGSPTGFTLTELLVVIAIIALLAATQVPALSRAKPKSQTARCASNMRIWGMATAMYLADNSDHLPYFAFSGTDYTQPFWESLLAPYVARVARPGGSFQSQPGVLFSYTEMFTNEVRKCPSGSYSAPDFYQGTWNPASSGINGWNCWIGANVGLGNTAVYPLTGPFFYGSLNGSYNPPLKGTQIRK